MRDDVAVRLRNVSKTYRLYGSQREQLLDVLGLSRLGALRGRSVREFHALTDVSFEVPRGGRLAILGRNGAGKTTLLKLISGNFAPSGGEIEINGAIQALMGTGLGFHEDYTGRENIKASLQFNGLAREATQAAIDDIVAFCELGEFIDQPFKTYSLGMQARLMFATATAIRPDILIIDEVLGAGDTYFAAKSSARMQALASSGCTLLLVSHSTAQVLQFCDRAVWLENGRVQMMGDAFSVVKRYEEFMNNRRATAAIGPSSTEKTAGPAADSDAAAAIDIDALDPQALHCVAPGGISRWEGMEGLKVSGFALVASGRLTDVLQPLEDAEFVIHLRADLAGAYRCTYGILIHDGFGNAAARLISPPDAFTIEAGGFRRIRIALNPNRLGPGIYTLGISVLEATTTEAINNAGRFDLLGRSFQFEVRLPGSESASACNFYHAANWTFDACTLPLASSR